MRSGINRVLLALLGLVLLGGGLLVLFGGLDLRRHWNVDLPSGWPLAGPHAVVLSDADRTRYVHDGWWWPVAFAVLGVLALLFLWWLLAQLRDRTPSRVEIGGARHDESGVQLRGPALGSALGADLSTQPEVVKARSALTGRPGAPRARLVATVAPDSRPVDLLARTHSEVLEHARSSARLERLPTELRIRVASSGPHRVD